MCLLILEKEGDRERERNIDVKEKHKSGASHTCPDMESNLQPRCVPWPEIERTTFFDVQDDTPTTWVTRPGQKLHFKNHLYTVVSYNLVLKTNL